MQFKLYSSVDRMGVIISYFYALVVVITTYEVLMRYVFSSPTSWVHELSIALCSVSFAFGGPYAEGKDAHLRISAAYDRAGSKMRSLYTAISILAGAIYLGGLLYAFTMRAIETGWKFDDGHWAPETTGRAWDIPIPPFMNAAIAVCCLVFLILLFIRKDISSKQD